MSADHVSGAAPRVRDVTKQKISVVPAFPKLTVLSVKTVNKHITSNNPLETREFTKRLKREVQGLQGNTTGARV